MRPNASADHARWHGTRGPRVLLAGGGSGGSATPVLAVADALREIDPSVRLLYLGTRVGPEGALVRSRDIPFAAIAAGKLRRYWDVQNLLDPLKVLVGIGQSYRLARAFRPSVAFAAGGFASVPPLVGARLAGARIAIHQQDVRPGLANRLLTPLASQITVSVEPSLRHFPGGGIRGESHPLGTVPPGRTTWTGNPVRREVLETNAAEGFRRLGLDARLPLLLVTGGGTGALSLNRLVGEAASRLVERFQVLHLTGTGRGVPARTNSPRYRAVEFLVEEMPHVMAAATLVLSRAGMGTLTELAALGKATVIVPMPGSHQEENASAFERLGAIQVAREEALSPTILAERLFALLDDEPRRRALGAALAASMPRDAATRIAERLLALATSS